ncbi:MAG: phytanoyl-CoA dioxygenase family protein [Gammaproteobacteria bacterium]|nr:phytanoyl-CoA dioxygenase family protein [Gammaproteobacteria bacterium]
MFEIDTSQIERFRRDGFLIVDQIIDEQTVEALRNSAARLFHGEFETGVAPDEVNWQASTSDPAATRQVCNAWKADLIVASVVLREDIGRAIARLAGWPGSRIMQDNVLHKPPGTTAIGYHQDSAYHQWITPREMVSCWIALDDTFAEGGTLEVVRGSHTWGICDEIGPFHRPEDYRLAMVEEAARQGVEPEVVPIVVAAGGGSFHHGTTWHGSGVNNTERSRRSVVTHALSSETRFVRKNIDQGNGPIYGRYMRLMGNEMDENFFPILWTEDGGRTKGLDRYLTAVVN